MIIVTGKTFEHRDTLIKLGGRWNNADRNWQFDHLADIQVRILRSLVGLIVVEQTRRPAWLDDDNPFDHDREAGPVRDDPVMVGDDPTYFNHFADQDPVAFIGFTSLGAFADHVAGLKRPDNNNRTCDIGWTAKPGYAGTSSLIEAIDIARTGWTDGLGMMDQLLAPEPMTKRRKRSMTGGTVNVGRMLAGQPDHMVRRQRVTGRRVITLFVETVMWEGITANNAIIRVVLIAAMVDRLEQEGYSCNIVAVYSAKRRDWRKAYQTVIRIKDAGERLSLADISFAFGHPSFGRRLVYAAEGSLPQCDLTHNVRGVISEAFTAAHPPGRNEFYIPQLRSNESDIWKMLDKLQPDNLPIKLKKDR